MMRALISVYDKTNLADFASGLEKLGIEIISSGGTAKLLSENSIKVTEVSDFTGSPEMMDGRVKTLHPRIHGGILLDRNKKKHAEDAEKNSIVPIDIVVVNFYPFEKTCSDENATMEEIIENIDIGGPAMARSAAKNYQHVAVIVNPKRYSEVLAELKKQKMLLPKTKESLALEALEYVAYYDAIIAKHMRGFFAREEREEFPSELILAFRKIQNLRYGENPGQRAALYTDSNLYSQKCGPSLISTNQIQGKMLSYNNILDANAAFELCSEFEEPTAVIVKHNNPSGVASDSSILNAYKKARSVDPEAAFGGVVAINRLLDETVAVEIMKGFVEVIVAPSYSPRALEQFREKKNIRLLNSENMKEQPPSLIEYRSIPGGLLIQDADVNLFNAELKVVTKRQPSEEEKKAMLYAWKIAKYVKSNAIVYARSDRAVGIGAGQMKRVDAAKLAAMIAKEYSGEVKGCAMASDAFFPFRDGIEYAAKLGITAIIQPGGSIKDSEVIAAADAHKMTMIFTGTRHFRH